jgi:hypothetical protein
MSEEKELGFPVLKVMTPEERAADLAEARRKHIERIKTNKTCQSYWWPRLPADIPVPKTALVEFPYELTEHVLYGVEDGQLPEDAQKALDRGISKIEEMCDLFGYPCFIKTGIFSDKHNWGCFVPDRESVRSKVIQIVYSWACVGGFGADDSEWFVVRELIPTKPAMLFDGKMPVTRERRYFAVDGEVKWHQPYWPREAFPEWTHVDLLGHESIEAALASINEETEEEVRYLSSLASSISKAVGGDWSIDFLQDANGRWYMIDMAEARKSYVDKTYKHGKRWIDG